MKIFVSYARADKPQVIKLVAALEKSGASVWWDRDLVPGSCFREAIQQEIDHSNFVVVLWTAQSIKSEFVRDEAARAHRQQKLVPIRIANVDIPLGFGELHTADCSESFEPVFEALGRQPMAAGGRATSDRKLRLTKVERLILINQYEILGKLDPKQKTDHDLTLKKLQNGYLDRLTFDTWLEDELEESIHSDVFDILELHRAMRFSYSKLKLSNTDLNDDISFQGFDGNYETSYMAYAQYILKDERLYQELHGTADYNSHRPMLPKYVQMLRLWKNMGKRYSLSKLDLKSLVSVAVDPSEYETYLNR